ncbi:MAG: hypothetical protein SGILL_009880, partial [Bacillariaceae sp.]
IGNSLVAAGGSLRALLNENEEPPQINNEIGNTNTLAANGANGKRQNAPCILVERLVQQQNGTGYTEWACEMDAEDAADSGTYFATFEGGLPEDYIEGQVISGYTTLIAEGAKIHGGQLVIPAGSKITYGSTNDDSPSNNVTETEVMDRAPFGKKDVLVIRMTSSDRKVSSSVSQLEDDVFGTGQTDILNLRRQFHACSQGQMKMLPFTGTTTTGVEVQNGVVEVTVTDAVKGVGFKKIENAAIAQATEMFGDLKSQFHYVMLCLPPGTKGSW